MSTMKDRWVVFFKAVGAQGDPEEFYKDIVERYSESHRFYHTLDHIAHCLKEFEEIRQLCDDSLAVEMALWFHDIFYDVWPTGNNEKMSAEYAMKQGKKMGLKEHFLQRVSDYILYTTHKKECIHNRDAQFVVDIDLSILGKPFKEFDEYEAKIKEEYRWFVLTGVFNKKRAEILRKFLDRSSIYQTDYFRAKYETQARRNLM